MKTKIIRLLLTVFSTVIFLAANAQNPNLMNSNNKNGCDGVEFLKIDLSRASTSDTTFCNRWVEVDQEWVPRTIIVNAYDDSGRLTESITSYYVDSTQSFTQLLRDTHTYHSNDSLKTTLNELWNTELDGGSWDNTSFNEFEYDDKNSLIYNLVYFSPYGSHELNLGNRKYYSYNADGLQDTTITQYWNTNEEKWFYQYRNRYYYDEEMRLAESYQDYANNQDGSYTLSQREIFIRNDESHAFDAIIQYYSAGSWLNSNRERSTLNDKNFPDSILSQQWNTTDEMWDTLVKELALFEYNQHGKLTVYTTLSYYFTYFNNQRLSWFYNEDNNMTASLSQQFDHGNQRWRNVNNCFYPLPLVTSLNDNLNSNTDQVYLYPNPVHDFVKVRFNEKQLYPAKISIVNTSGQIVHESLLEANVPINTTNLPPGLYVTRISVNDQMHTTKMVVK